MRRIFSLLVIVLISRSVLGQVPQKISYQAVIRNTNDVLVTNHMVGMRVSILQGSATGTPVYTETQTPTTNANGLVSIEIGGGAGFGAINWANYTFFIKTETDPQGGTAYTITGTSQILSVPYALHAKTVSGYSENDPLFVAHAAYGITGTNITNWTTAFGWGNHSGLYRPLSYVPSWNEISGRPTTISGYGITDAVTISDNQTISGNKTFSGKTSVTTPVESTDAANKAYVDALKSQIEELQISAGIRVKDIDGNIYKTVTIGTQVWMAENLKTTKYNDGTAIPNVTVNATWNATTTGAYCDYSNTPSNSAIYGRLYNWYAVDNNVATKMGSNGGKNACPTGWHVPTSAEWTTLTNYLTNNGYGYEGSGNDIGKSMAATSGWTIDPTAGNVGNDQASNNSSGFTALPSGDRSSDGTFRTIGYLGNWWSSTEYNTANTYYRCMSSSLSYLYSDYIGKLGGFSVRCLKD
jgi:uncharacterized protein (TIGR02145 family)